MKPTLTVTIRGGARICLPPSIGLITPYVLLEQEDWFEDEIRFVRHCLRPGMAVLDVGANFGVYTLAMAQAVGPQGKVWAFEPTPDTAEYLEATIATNQATQVQLMRVALSDQEGSVQFHVGENSELNAIAKAGESGADVVSVPARTLDKLAQELGWHGVTFAKLDVEGHEAQVLAGGATFFSSASPLVMFEIKSSDQVDLSILDTFRAMGYGFYRLVPGLLMLAPFDAAAPIDPYQLNLFACKLDRAQQLAADGLLAQSAGTAPAPDKAAWTQYLQSTVYGSELGGGWPTKAGLFAAPGLQTYLDGLALFAQSRNTRIDAAQRFAMLQQALQCVSEAVAKKDTLPRTISLARLSWEFGARSAAVEILQKAGRRSAEEAGSLFKEPFLCPSPRYEQLATRGPGDEWVPCAIAEQLEKLRAHSSVYVGPQGIGLLESFAQVPFRSPEMERRRQLIRMRAGMQAGPEPSPLLAQRSEENLNPEFWSGTVRV